MELVFGVLIGVIASCVVALALVGDHIHAGLVATIKEMLAIVKAQDERITFLEKRKALLAESAASYQVPGVGVMAGKPAQKPRTWNQDAPAVGE